jgi:hypothetical protein
MAGQPCDVTPSSARDTGREIAAAVVGKRSRKSADRAADPEEHRERAVRNIHDAFGVVVNEDGTKSYPEYKMPRQDEGAAG